MFQIKNEIRYRQMLKAVKRNMAPNSLMLIFNQDNLETKESANMLRSIEVNNYIKKLESVFKPIEFHKDRIFDENDG